MTMEVTGCKPNAASMQRSRSRDSVLAPRVLRGVYSFWLLVLEAHERRVQRRALQSLDERMLSDIGVPRSEIDAVIEGRIPFRRHMVGER